MARFAVSNSHDQSAALWIMTFLLLSYTTLTILVRGFVKVSMLGLDDGIAGLAQLLTYGNVFSVIQVWAQSDQISVGVQSDAYLIKYSLVLIYQMLGGVVTKYLQIFDTSLISLTLTLNQDFPRFPHAASAAYRGP